MVQSNATTNENGEAIIISIQDPYLQVLNVNSFDDNILGENTDCYYEKEFRWGIDGVTYSDYSDLTDLNLRSLILNPTNPFYIQFKYTQIGECTLTFETISLEVITQDGVITQVPQFECGSLDNCGCENLVIDCCGEEGWNPYNISPAAKQYEQLSKVASDLFGWCVNYFKTEADQRSKDIIFREYSLENVIANDEVKILVPDNEFPTRSIQFSSIQFDYPVEFEVHIVKSAFRQIFGNLSKPEQHDFLYVPIMNRMYEVNNVMEPDDFMNEGTYWRVSLVTWQDRTNQSYEDTTIRDEVDDIVLSVEEVFGEDQIAQEKDARKPNQYNTIGTRENDYIRRSMPRNLTIKEQKLYNNWTIVSKFHYQLGSINKGDDAVVYRYVDGWSNNENRSFTFWASPSYSVGLGSKKSMTGVIANTEGNTVVTTTYDNTFIVGDWVYLTQSGNYNGIQKVIEVNDRDITLDVPFDGGLGVNPRIRTVSSAHFMSFGDSFNLTIAYQYFIIETATERFIFDLSEQNVTLDGEEWYAFVININNTFNQVSLFLYQAQEQTGVASVTETADLNLIYEKTITNTVGEVSGNNAWKLLGSDTDITNVRLFKRPIEEEERSLVLSQYVVQDTSLSLIVDNASPRLRMPKITNPK